MYGQYSSLKGKYMLNELQPQESQEVKPPRWHLIYYLLATFDLITVTATLFLSFTILTIYSESVDVNNTWAKRAGNLSDLSQILIKVNTPGNDVFESNAPDEESAKLVIHHQEFLQLYGSIYEDVNRLEDQALVQQLVLNLQQVNTYEMDIVAEANGIFAYYKKGERTTAGGRMAIMDQHFAKASTSLAEVNHIIRSQQDLLLSSEIAKAKELSRYEYLIVGLILLMVCAVFIYGKILARKMAESEQTIRHLLARNRGIVETCSDGIITTDEQGIIETANAVCETIFGCPVDTLYGKNIASLLRNDNYDDTQQDLFHWLIMLKNQHSLNSEQQLNGIRSDGVVFPLHLDIGQLQLKDENELSYVVTFRDISEQNALEQALLAAKNKAETANKAKGQFLANMSHEIRTPMNGVLGMLGLLCQEKLADKQQHYVNLAQYSANSLLVLVNDILDFSKVESGKLDLEIIDFNLHNQLANFIKSMAIQSEEKGLELMLDVSGVEPTFVRGDPGRILQILTNLVGNSIKFTNHGEISIEAKTQA
ncbi:MAG: PAS domain S-box-containing protein, partial [Phenylobacterium sp.]